MMHRRVAVTGAASYTGRYLTEILTKAGQEVVNLSNRKVPIGSTGVGKISSSYGLEFSPDHLRKSLHGCDVLYCTYWIRFATQGDSHSAAAHRCRVLFDAARDAGVRKIVFSSHTRASLDSPISYLAGKAEAVSLLRSCGIPQYAVVRPCGIFGDTPEESILFNNAACVMRRTPLFLLPKDGSSRFQPIHVRDMAQLMFEMGESQAEAEEVDACGPEAPTSIELFQKLRNTSGAWAHVAASGLSEGLITNLTAPINWITGDILLDRDDLALLCSGLTVADQPDDPRIQKRRSLFAWLEEMGDRLGRTYISSLDRYY